jgi:hypothetical protein
MPGLKRTDPPQLGRRRRFVRNPSVAETAPERRKGAVRDDRSKLRPSGPGEPREAVGATRGEGAHHSSLRRAAGRIVALVASAPVLVSVLKVLEPWVLFHQLIEMPFWLLCAAVFTTVLVWICQHFTRRIEWRTSSGVALTVSAVIATGLGLWWWWPNASHEAHVPVPVVTPAPDHQPEKAVEPVDSVALKLADETLVAGKTRVYAISQEDGEAGRLVVALPSPKQRWILEVVGEGRFADAHQMLLCHGALIVSFASGSVARVSVGRGKILERRDNLRQGPLGLACAGEYLFLGDPASGDVLRLDRESLESLSEWEAMGTRMDEFGGTLHYVYAGDKQAQELRLMDAEAMVAEAVPRLDDIGFVGAYGEDLLVVDRASQCARRVSLATGRVRKGPGVPVGAGTSAILDDGEASGILDADSGDFLRIGSDREKAPGTRIPVGGIPMAIAAIQGSDTVVVASKASDELLFYDRQALMHARGRGPWPITTRCKE